MRKHMYEVQFFDAAGRMYATQVEAVDSQQAARIALSKVSIDEYDIEDMRIYLQKELL